MISELKIRNFKSLESVDLKLGHFNLLVGTNASGKSNFLDALRFLQGIANDFTLDEVLNGKPQTTTSVKWDGIRGGSRLVAFRAPDGTSASAISIEVTQPTLAGNSSLTYSLEAAPLTGKLVYETIGIDGGRHWPESDTSVGHPLAEAYPSDYESSVIPRLVYLVKIGTISSTIEQELAKNESQRALIEQQMAKNESLRALIDQRITSAETNLKSRLAHPDLAGNLKHLQDLEGESRNKSAQIRAHFAQVRALWDSYVQQIPALLSKVQIDASIIEDDSFQNLTQEADRILDLLKDIQSIDPRPDVLRKYSKSGTISRLNEHGDGFAGLVQRINETPETKRALLEWLKELRPDEIEDLITIRGAVDDLMVAVQEGNKQFPAEVLSDGTLRFIALAVAFFQPSMPKILIIEEIEKGLHPSRLRLLLELMRSQSKRTGTQVFATTHSPTLLNWLTEEDRRTTFVCTRDAESAATRMRSLSEVPNLEELIKKNYNLDQLFEEGWLESVLHES
jgi:energy-coupling factor transporter ATP-binding protein EcfA2